MVIHIRTYLLYLFLCCSFLLSAQRHLRTEIEFNKSSVYIGEPIEVSLSIYSSTWFTDGVDPGNVKINGAYTVYFRSLSTSKKMEGQLYSGVTLFFHVFPYNEEDVVFPSLEFIVETPDLGGYEGIKRKVKTRARTIRVKPIPPGIEKDNWLVSSSVRVYDSWKSDLSKVKVGDVLERKIVLKVGNTISEFIPAIYWDSIQGISQYPIRPTLKNNKSKTEISAERVDSNRYLFEKEGAYTIPEIVIQWWNPVYKKMYKRVLKEKIIHVAANPDLGMLESVKKSLEASIVSEQEEIPKTYLGLSLKKFLMLVVSVFVLVFFFVKLLLKVVKKITKKKELFRKSEAYFFQLFLKQKDAKKGQETLYKWIDQLELLEPSLNCFIENYGTDELKRLHDISKLNLKLDYSVYSLKKEWKVSRKKYLNSKKTSQKLSANWVNP